jgi:hypothetical protein
VLSSSPSAVPRGRGPAATAGDWLHWLATWQSRLNAIAPSASPIQRSCDGLRARARANGCNEDKDQDEGEQEKEQQQDEQHEDEEKDEDEEGKNDADNGVDECEDEEEDEHVASKEELEEQGDEDKGDDDEVATKSMGRPSRSSIDPTCKLCSSLLLSCM